MELTLTTLYKVLLAATLGTGIFVVHSFSLNRYLRNRNMLAMSMILPPVAMVITTTIATNFYLSLGMIGALSIVRYRTPVKSSYELALLFTLITVGIVVGMNPLNGVALSLFVMSVGPLVAILSYLFPKLIIHEGGKQTDFVELMIRVKGKSDQDFLILPPNGVLISYEESNLLVDPMTTLIAKFTNMDTAKQFKKQVEQSKNISSINISQVQI